MNPVGGLCLAQGGPRVDLGGDSVLTSVDAPTSTPYLRTFSFFVVHRMYFQHNLCLENV